MSENKDNSTATPGIVSKAVSSVHRKYKAVTDSVYGLLSGKKRLLVFVGIWSIVLNYFLEASLRKNLITGFTQGLFFQPLTFLFNSLIIFCSFSLLLFLKRRMFYFLIVSVLWIAMAVVNFILLCMRMSTPLNGSDFRVITTALDIIETYLSKFQIVLVILAVIGVVAFLSFAFIKGRKSERNLYFSGSAFGVIISVTLAAVLFYSNVVVNSEHFDNLPNTYREYGFTYSFLSSVLDHGIKKPKNYKEDKVKEVMNSVGIEADDVPTMGVQKPENDENRLNAVIGSLSDDDTGRMPENGIRTASVDKPNIIFLQLESFYDPMNVENLVFDKDPLPVYRSLMNECMSGLLTVPSIGAGTANTEFEVITGMDIDHFGIAEYPFLSILQNHSCESIAFDCKEYGYSAHGIHNHTGTFYDRHIVYKNLGFDTFTSIENMTPVSRNERGWAKDSMLVNEIMGVLNYTPEQADVVYTVSVQSHGKYPDSPEAYDAIYNEEHPPHILVSGNEEDPEKPGVDYWVNQIYEVDAFVGDLVSTLKTFAEPTVLVMYGDHLPAFSLDTWNIREGDLYQTQYVIWSNFDIPDYGDRDLYAFQLSSYVMSMFDIDSGYINKLHQKFAAENVNFDDDESYFDDMHLFQYDMLYGKKYVYGCEERYFPSNIRYGYKDITITDINIQGDTLYVYGTGFNERYSQIFVNGVKKDTTFVKDGCVSASGVELNDGDTVRVVQVTTDYFHINKTNEFVYHSGGSKE